MLERGSLAVDDANLRNQLLRQLIRSEVSTFVNRLYFLFAQNYDLDWPTVAVEKSVSTKNKKGKRDEERQVDDIGRGMSAEFTPADITPQQRDSLVSLLSQMKNETMKHVSTLVKNINACLRANADLSLSGNGLPLDEVLYYCDNLASCHLGIDISISTLRGAIAKRKRQDRLLALEIASQVAQQIVNAATMKETSYLASLTLFGAALFGQCIAGWPLPVHGKLVPQLSAWINKKLSLPTASSASYAAAINELRSAKAGILLTRLTEVVMEEARQDDNDDSNGMVSEEEKNALVEEFLSTVARCRQAMQSNSPKSSTQ